MKSMPASLILMLVLASSGAAGAADDTQTYEGPAKVLWNARTENLAVLGLGDYGTLQVEVTRDAAGDAVAVHFRYDGLVGSADCLRHASGVSGEIEFRLDRRGPMVLPCNNAQASMDALAEGACSSRGFANAADFSQGVPNTWAEVVIDTSAGVCS